MRLSRRNGGAQDGKQRPKCKGGPRTAPSPGRDVDTIQACAGPSVALFSRHGARGGWVLGAMVLRAERGGSHLSPPALGALASPEDPHQRDVRFRGDKRLRSNGPLRKVLPHPRRVSGRESFPDRRLGVLVQGGGPEGTACAEYRGEVARGGGFVLWGAAKGGVDIRVERAEVQGTSGSAESILPLDFDGTPMKARSGTDAGGEVPK